MIKKISLYIIFLITISATAFANTCDIFEDALIGNESVAEDPFYNINKKEYEKLNLFGLVLDEINEGEDFLNINLINVTKILFLKLRKPAKNTANKKPIK